MASVIDVGKAIRNAKCMSLVYLSAYAHNPFCQASLVKQKFKDTTGPGMMSHEFNPSSLT